ncbi:M20/M25/M40 family metallo-hydrolase [Haliangium sp. UPWRP_2]|uniref:M20/M25/M40 family metallo-hydrolase n=1 Tax=Haliangium sp. UPWRP_2 TaxID=1931276 RepID=UPI0011B22C30|nr:M20/M25/M40 family metallo-hydrolase [Haliangium sp. UPWRP_2]
MKKPPEEPKQDDRYLPPEVAEERFQDALRRALGSPKQTQPAPANSPATESPSKS